MQMDQMAIFLQKFGGWGMCVVLLVGIIYLYRSTNKLLERRNEQFIEVLKETTAMLQQNSSEARRVESLMGRLEHFLENRER